MVFRVTALKVVLCLPKFLSLALGIHNSLCSCLWDATGEGTGNSHSY